MLRARKSVAMKPPSGNATTSFRPMGSGATAHPIQVSAGGLARGIDLEDLDRFPLAVMDGVQRVDGALAGANRETVGPEARFLRRVRCAWTRIVGLRVQPIFGCGGRIREGGRLVPGIDQANAAGPRKTGSHHPFGAGQDNQILRRILSAHEPDVCQRVRNPIRERWPPGPGRRAGPETCSIRAPSSPSDANLIEGPLKSSTRTQVLQGQKSARTTWGPALRPSVLPIMRVDPRESAAGTAACRSPPPRR